MSESNNARTATLALLDRERPAVMGIVNVTPDSFSDGGRYLDSATAIAHALRLVAEGADIVDVGGESTRPPGKDYGSGSAQIDEESELARVIPVIEGIRRANATVPISVDTMKSGVALRAVEAGATIINDVSAGRYDARIIDVAAGADLPYVMMHGHDPSNLQPSDRFRYTDVVREVFDFLEERIETAGRHGARRVIADVGLGFAKGASENVALLREHRRFLALGVPLLVGASRKSFIGRLLGDVPPAERMAGSLAAHAVATLNGASILRVHDVKESVQFLKVFLALAGGRGAE